MTGVRRPAYALLGSLALAGLGACTADGADGDGQSPAPEPTTTASTAPTAFAEPPDGAELTVAETGFSVSTYQPDASAELLSYGVIVGNPSEFMALDVSVDIRLLDADGQPIDEISGEPADDPEPRRQSLTRLLPGEQIGLGRTVPHYGGEVVELAVDVEAASWSPVSDQLWWSHPITASDVTTQDTGDSSVLRFAVDAAYTDDMIRGQLWIGGHFTAIFRDAGGAVVGGADCCHGTGGQVPVEVPPGRSDVELNLEHGTPARADDTRTEIYLPDPRENLPG